MEILPNDIVSEILLRSEPESLLRFKAVSHTWKETITNPDFVKSHAKRHNSKKLMLVYPDCSTVSVSFCDGEEATVKKISNNFAGLGRELRIIGSCNGLFLGEIHKSPSSYQLCIWNPSTGEYKQVPIPDGISNNDDSEYGFGYASSDNTYKVLCISPQPEKLYRMHLYSTQTNSWKKLRYSSKPRCRMVLVKGRLHFIPSRKKEIILAFDVEDEEFKEVETPVPDDIKDNHKELMVLNENLCICYWAHVRERKFSLWMMNEYGVKESWTKMVTIDFDDRMYFRNQLVLAFPRHIFENGKILVDNRTFDRFYKLDKQWVACYDPHNHTTRDLTLDCIPAWSEVHAYVETLISPNTA